jgi:arabidopsis histidine kinase 2/3/4 (cytokinin receptor)
VVASTLITCRSTVGLPLTIFTFNCRFEATRLIRSIEKKINDMIMMGEISANNYGNKAHWHVPILAMTADVIQATFEKCMQCGMDGYVSKPFEEQQLYFAVAHFLETDETE